MEKSNSAGEVLIVDDVPENLTILKTMLENQGYRIRPAINGKIALNAVLSRPPDIILLDIRMPQMDGYEFCSRLKSMNTTQSIPVIFISALTDISEKVKAFNIGGVDYITKPFQEQEVLARVETHLSLRRLHQQVEEQNRKLQKALSEIETLQGLIPICAWCKKIRDDDGFWDQVEDYFTKRSELKFSQGICPGCLKEHFTQEKREH